MCGKPPYPGAHSSAGKPHIPGHSEDGKSQSSLPLQMAVTEKMGIDGAVDDRQAEARHNYVFELLPDLSGVEFHGVHVGVPVRGVAGENTGWTLRVPERRT